MIIAQSFAYVEQFWAPVLESLDKNLSKYGFGSWPTFLEGAKKLIFKNIFFANFDIFFTNFTNLLKFLLF